MRRLVLCLIVLLASVVCLAADDLSVTVAPSANFAAFRTFALGDITISSPRPEVDNPLFKKRLTNVIRAALTARGLKETTDRPDLEVSCILTNQDVDTLRSHPRGPLRYTHGDLMIDMTTPGGTSPVWHGVYRADEQTGSRLLQKVQDGAKKLINRYPRQSR